MRISTAQFHRAALAGMNDRSSDLARIQAQMASGKRVNSPSDDPAAAVHIQELGKSYSESQQFVRNGGAATTRLSYEDQALSDITSLMQRVRDLTVQANSGALTAADRTSILTEVTQRQQDLLDLSNRRDANGDYLFSGFAAQTQPFSRTGASVSYQGDQGVRTLQIGAAQRIADGHSGYDVFMNVPAGNGTFVTGLGATNTGNGAIDAGSITNPAAWAADTYTIAFTSPTAWTVSNAGGPVASGTFTPGGAIAFNGASVTIQGQPAAGDTFTLTPSSSEDMFTTLDKLRTALSAPGDTDAQKAQFATSMGAALNQIDQSLGNISSVRAQVGARLNAIDTATSSQQDLQLDLKSSISDLQDLDYAAAISDLTLKQAGLQAAQASYSRIAQLSLFDYLR
ncbi:MAG: flagellar hook-associated protein FlgL [Gammaproteobacteria bacterium]